MQFHVSPREVLPPPKVLIKVFVFIVTDVAFPETTGVESEPLYQKYSTWSVELSGSVTVALPVAFKRNSCIKSVLWNPNPFKIEKATARNGTRDKKVV